ncbi:MAG: diguanylate cyclase [Acidobacteria bacterium]|nr:diguanylate cyclase [Acidobacteriota bacterium]
MTERDRISKNWGQSDMKVLVADDSLVMRRLLESTLSGWGFDVICAHDGCEALRVLLEPEAPQLAILDWMMPGMSGPDICKEVRERRTSGYTYILLLTSRGLREDIVEGMGAGADDYVVKPFDKHELDVRLRAGRRIIDLQQELLRVQEALREQATHDALTGLWNRASVLETLERESVRASRERRPLGVAMIDIDHFKQVNDQHGHQAGDAILKAFGARLTETMRPYDFLGRYGGEEFLAVVPGCDAAGLNSHAERMRAVVEAQPFVAGGAEFRVTASFGLSAKHPEEPIESERLLRAADDALYLAKRQGRNRAVYLPPQRG